MILFIWVARGEDLGDESFDIRYLSMSSRLTHFNTYEAWTDRIQRKLSDTPGLNSTSL